MMTTARTSTLKRTIVISAFIFMAFELVVSTAAEMEAPLYLLIEPVVTRSDEGEAPAPIRLHKEKVTKVLQQAGVEPVWLPEVFLDSTATRDGELLPGEIVALGRERELWGEGVPRIHMIFVNWINWKDNPRGLGMISAPICLLALPAKCDQPDMEAYCIIHEVGHNLGLIHTIDDPHADHDVPNVMGDGPFAERVGDSALQSSQVATIQKSPILLQPQSIANESEE